jgi:hypothetical protein
MRRWSNALVRAWCRSADGTSALLGLAADRILVRESAGASSPVRPVSSRRPTNNPNPNTAAAQPSNGEPGSPAGGR